MGERSMSNLVQKQPAEVSLADIKTMANVMCQSGMFPSWNTPEKMMTLMLICRAEGKDPATVVNRYDCIEGKPTKKPQAMLQDFLADGERADARVRYHTWTPEELAERRRERLEVARAVRQDDDAGFELLLSRLSADKIAEMRQVLSARIIEWDLQDAAGEPIPVSADTVRAVLDLPGWLPALWDGLFGASEGAAAKNA